MGFLEQDANGKLVQAPGTKPVNADKLKARKAKKEGDKPSDPRPSGSPEKEPQKPA